MNKGIVLTGKHSCPIQMCVCDGPAYTLFFSIPVIVFSSNYEVPPKFSINKEWLMLGTSYNADQSRGLMLETSMCDWQQGLRWILASFPYVFE